MKVYVVTHPESIRGIYPTWAECQAAVAGIPGARYQAVGSREAAEAMLRGEAIVLPPGTWAFVDGNHMGGIGVVLVEQGPDGPRSVRDVATTAYEVFGAAGIPGLTSRPEITAAVDRLRNVLTELGGLYAVTGLVAPGTSLTVVHDYEGVGAWLEGRWKAKDPLVAAIVAACRTRIAERRLTVAFRHQRGHESTYAGRNDFAAYNARADRLATEAALRHS
ncbi:MAG TPA: ribonuclease H family protein [Methylomirabilota bacterium]|nr:ribonuclease H family protein [Methylomirabilota bacterium]